MNLFICEGSEFKIIEKIEVQLQ